MTARGDALGASTTALPGLCPRRSGLTEVGLCQGVGSFPSSPGDSVMQRSARSTMVGWLTSSQEQIPGGQRTCGWAGEEGGQRLFTCFPGDWTPAEPGCFGCCGGWAVPLRTYALGLRCEPKGPISLTQVLGAGIPWTPASSDLQGRGDCPFAISVSSPVPSSNLTW